MSAINEFTTIKSEIQNETDFTRAIDNEKTQFLNLSVSTDACEEANPLKHVITKKTLRGRKIKCPLPKIERCSICLEYAEYTKEQWISCSMCKSKWHPSCYHKKWTNESLFSFTCDRCQCACASKKEISEYYCFICNESDGILCENSSSGEFFHTLCLRWIPELYENNTQMEDIDRSNIRKWRYKNSCKYCQDKLSKDKAVLKCENPKCKCYYHIPCAIEKGMLFSITYFSKYYCLENHVNDKTVPFYCSAHNKRLATAYRKDVIYNQSKFSTFISSRKTSISEITVIEENTTNNTETKEQSWISDFGCDELSTNNNAFDLNFNEITCHFTNAVDFFNVSPKDKIPWDFNYTQDIEL